MLTRMAALAVAVIAIPACSVDDDDWWEDGDQEVRIYNAGTESVYITIDAEGGENDGFHTRTLAAGAWYSEDFEGAYEVEVRISRQSDGLLLYSDEFDREDFDDENGTITIEVNP